MSKKRLKDARDRNGYPMRGKYRFMVLKQRLEELQNQVEEARFCGFQNSREMVYGTGEDYGNDLDNIQD